jgi:anti-sigma regulatory factor (Ser/Thr protein kinase)
VDIVELIEIALANSDSQRVEVAALEPASIETEAVSAVAQILSELVDNAIAFSEPGDEVRVTGLHEQGDYLISISDRGVGLPEDLIDELNRLLSNERTSSGAEPKLGIAMVARLADRHDIGVQLVPGAPGTTARVTVPGRLVGEPVRDRGEGRAGSGEARARGYRLPPRSDRFDDVFAQGDEIDQTVDLTRFERGHQTGTGVVAMSEEAKRAAEAFLEKAFAPLMERRGVTERPAPTPQTASGNGNHAEPPAQPASHEAPQGGTVTALRVRVPGENFSLVEDDASTMAAERAIDIRTALSKYAEGRKSARKATVDEGPDSQAQRP